MRICIIAFLTMALLPLALTAQTRKTTSFKQQKYTPKPYMSKKGATSSFSLKKVTASRFLNKSTVGRNDSRMRTTYSSRTRITR